MNLNEKIKKGKEVSMNCTIATVVLTLLKGVVGYISGSIALIADSFHSFSDIFTILATWIGLKISQKKPDKKFPYGYYKAETFVSLFVSIFVIAAGVGIFRESVISFFTPNEIRIGYIALSVSALSALVSYIISFYEIKIGKEIKSNALTMNGYESRMDVVTSISVFIGVLSSYLGIKYVEGAVGIFISFMLVKYGVKGFYESILILMDASPDVKLEKKILNMILKIENVKDVKFVKLRKSGMVIFGEATIIVKGSINVERAHEISDEIENKLKREIPELNEMMIHIEPEKKSEYVVSIPVDGKSGKIISKKFSRALYFAFISIKNKDITGIKVIENPYKEKKIRVGLSIGNFLSNKCDVVIAKNIGEISFHVLRDNFIDIYRTNEINVSDALKKYFDGKLEKLKKETKEVE